MKNSKKNPMTQSMIATGLPIAAGLAETVLSAWNEGKSIKANARVELAKSRERSEEARRQAQIACRQLDLMDREGQRRHQLSLAAFGLHAQESMQTADSIGQLIAAIVHEDTPVEKVDALGRIYDKQLAAREGQRRDAQRILDSPPATGFLGSGSAGALDMGTVDTQDQELD